MSLFSYESKLTNVLSYVADLFILNVIYLICCIPIVTIGAAQAGLYTATRQLIDPNDDRSAIKAIFRGFANGFWKITLVNTIFLALLGMLIYTVWIILDYGASGLYMHWALPAIMLGIMMVIQTLLPLFHYRFNCKASQLVRNCLLLLISHPLRCLAVTLMVWAPMIALILGYEKLLWDLGALFITVYYSIAFLFGAFLMIKPFNLLIEDMGEEDQMDEE